MSGVDTERAADKASNDAAGGPAPGGDDAATYYLGFDCATKTFGFSLIAIHATRFLRRRKYLRQRMRELKAWIAERPTDPVDVKALAGAISDIETESKSYIEILDGETKDLVPGTPDKEIRTIQRVKAIAAYVRGRVMDSIAKHVRGPLEVVIEFQEGPNAKSRMVVPALITLFADRKVYLVGPSLKNKIHLSEKGKYCYFVEKYAKSYDANKAHAKYNFAMLEALFGTQIPATKPPSLRGHIADSCMQVLGHLSFGDTENPESHF